MTTSVRGRFLQSGRRGFAAILVAAAGLAASSVGASAQYYDREVEAILSPRAVVWRLSRQGYTGLGHPRFDGGVYSVEAQSPWGNRVLLLVDARDGAIIDRERVEAPLYPPGRVGPRRPGFGWTEDEVEVRAPRPEPRYARAAPEGGVPTNPFASNLPSRPPRPEEASRGNPLSLNPDQAAPGRKPVERPRSVAKAVPPKAPSATPVEPAPALQPGEAVKAAEPKPPAAKPAFTASVPPPETLPAPQPRPTSRPVTEKPAADAGSPEAPQRNVRVIGGVTPVQGAAKSDDPKPATPSTAATE